VRQAALGLEHFHVVFKVVRKAKART
jgi:hypothetical protein